MLNERLEFSNKKFYLILSENKWKMDGYKWENERGYLLRNCRNDLGEKDYTKTRY